MCLFTITILLCTMYVSESQVENPWYSLLTNHNTINTVIL